MLWRRRYGILVGETALSPADRVVLLVVICNRASRAFREGNCVSEFTGIVVYTVAASAEFELIFLRAIPKVSDVVIDLFTLGAFGSAMLSL